MLLNKRKYKKEAVVGDPEEFQGLVDALATKVDNSCYPGKVIVGGDISDKVIDFLNDCFSLEDFPNIKDGLGLFRRITIARKVFDSLSSFEVHWIINGSDISKSDSWIKRVNAGFQETRNFKDTIPILMHLDSVGYTLVEYEGTLSIGGTYSKPNNNYGTSLRVDMDLKYAQTEGFFSSVDPHTTNRFSDLELEQYKNYRRSKEVKKEYKKITHVPFTSLFKVPKSNESKELFDSFDDSIPVSGIANLVLVATHGQIIGSVSGADGLAGDGRKVEPWFRKGGYSTKVDIEGICIYDGRTGTEKPHRRLLETIIDEVNSFPSADAFLRTEYDIAAYLYNADGILCFSQWGTLSISKDAHAYSGRIIKQQEMKEIYHSNPFDLEFERLERDNVKLKEIQDDFDNHINRRIEIGSKIGSEDFNKAVLSFIKETKDTFLPSSKKDLFSFIGCLDNNKTIDVFLTNSLMHIKEWSEFIEEAEVYEYNNHVTEEYVFDFTVNIFLNNKKGKAVPIIEYRGNLSVELENKNKTVVQIDLKANKLNTTIDRDYLPKPPVSRYSNLDY